ncbi:MAG: hypothetical protein E6G23_07035 [Actinobacteria bacterium]|nr:MAG: hypothetical protein E6G23_07035 [Actinomycetota bacterium]
MGAMGKSRVLFGVLSALVVVSAASAGSSSTPGITAKQILIGGTTPLSGPASAYAAVAKGADAYFKYVNDHGGVFGRSIKYKYEDDAYDPSQTIEKVRGLATTRSTRGRSATSRATGARPRSTAATSPRRGRARGSGSSIRTTPTGRSSSPASSAASARRTS